MIYVQGAIGLLLLVVVLTAASYWGARGAAKLLGVPNFRWFGVRPAAAPLWKRFCVRAASTLAALLVAVATSFAVLIVYGTTELTTIVKVLPGPAQRAGMLDDDKILSIDGTPVNTSEDVRAAVARGRDEKRVEVQRGSERLVLAVTRSDGRIAVQFVEHWVPIAAPVALATAVKNTLRVTAATLKSISPSTKVEVAGPVAIVRETGKQTDSAGSFLQLMGVLSAYSWPLIAELHVFAALTLLLFGATYPEAKSSPPGEERAYRLARNRQTLLASLGVMLLATMVSVVSDLAEAELSRAFAFFSWPAGIAIYPLIWLIALDLWKRPRAHALLAASIFIPCLVLFVPIYLLIRTRTELAREGFTEGWFVPLRSKA